jgi:hypothetical protein
MLKKAKILEVDKMSVDDFEEDEDDAFEEEDEES